MKGLNIIALALCALLYSCNSTNTGTHGPIVMGDSNSIITEPDSQYLRDFVTDLTPPEPKEETAKDTAAAQPDTQKVAAQPAGPQQAPMPAAAQGNASGLTIAFKEVTIIIPGLAAKMTGKQDLQKASGATYKLQSGNLDGNQLRMSGATITKVSQKYETDVAAKSNLGTLWLDDLGTSTSWQSLNGGKNIYNITGLDASKLATAKATPASIRNAISRSVKAAKLNRKKQLDWQNALRNVHNVRQKPLEVSLASVTWKIEGKDAKGKSFQKQVRIDMPE